MDKFMALKPRISEKTYGLSQALNTYVFNVPKGATKQTIAKAVAAQFSVTVTNVNVANAVGKAKRTLRKGGRPVAGKRASSRRAYVTLKAGETIPVFATIDEAGDAAAAIPAKKEKK